MAALKYKEGKGIYRLNLTHAQAELIATLIANVRLGTDDVYQEAAYELATIFREHGDFDDEVLSNSIHFDVTPETKSETPTIEISEKVDVHFVVGGQWPFQEVVTVQFMVDEQGHG